MQQEALRSPSHCVLLFKGWGKRQFWFLSFHGSSLFLLHWHGIKGPWKGASQQLSCNIYACILAKSYCSKCDLLFSHVSNHSSSFCNRDTWFQVLSSATGYCLFVQFCSILYLYLFCFLYSHKAIWKHLLTQFHEQKHNNGKWNISQDKDHHLFYGHSFPKWKIWILPGAQWIKKNIRGQLAWDKLVHICHLEFRSTMIKVPLL